MEYVINNLMIAGQVENWNITCNASNFSILTIPRELNIIFKTLSSNYRCRLFSVYALNLSFFNRIIWKAIRSLLYPILKKRSNLFKVKTVKRCFSL